MRRRLCFRILISEARTVLDAAFGLREFYTGRSFAMAGCSR